MRGIIFVLAIASFASVAPAQATKPAGDAWPLYKHAAAHISEGDRKGISSPASSTLSYQGFPPFPAEWHGLEKESFAYNAPALALTRKAMAMNAARWPTTDGARYLNACRGIANEIADAALYQHLQGDDAEAIEYVRDELHLADLLNSGPTDPVIEYLVAAGVRASALNRLEVITTQVAITSDAGDHNRLQADAAKALVRRLFTNDDPAARLQKLLGHKNEAELKPEQKEAFRTHLRRVQMERNLAAMSLACHLFRFEKSRWPASLDDLKAYLPAAPVDAWGPMGYVLVKGGLPDGADRPLVYSRCNSKDGLFYRVDSPQYGFYPGDGSGRHADQQKEGGQFRDVALWAPPAAKPEPTTRPLK
ncbi:MAG TPA: hypothetical protein VFC78_15295 [Tepidisphaeraceae bacterium]|nr:hypothetical protein [Tepidisphaeraceae bacterium]